MSQPGVYGFGAENVPGSELAIYDADAPQVVDHAFQQLVLDPQGELCSQERRRRAASFELAHAAVEKWEATFGTVSTLHRTYAEQDGLTVERLAVVQIFNFPGLGNLTRLMVNDEGPGRYDDGRTLRIRDFLISNRAKAFTWQETATSKAHYDTRWRFPVTTGPLIQPRSDYVQIINGSEYFTQLPRVGGYSTTLYESIVRRLQLEEFTGVLSSLGEGSYEPSEVRPYF